jgi:hypothetical protein
MNDLIEAVEPMLVFFNPAGAPPSDAQSQHADAQREDGVTT